MVTHLIQVAIRLLRVFVSLIQVVGDSNSYNIFNSSGNSFDSSDNYFRFKILSGAKKD